MPAVAAPPFSSVYGPVASWRYGRSLGIDPIGAVSTCSFDCVYCQLGAIERRTLRREVFVPTARVVEDLRAAALDGFDVSCFSGSGEPTLAANLGEMLAAAKACTGKRVGVLTNASLLGDATVRAELALADFVAAKLDASTEAAFRRVDRPVPGITLAHVRQGLLQFRQEYRGELAVQTMLLGHWPERDADDYIGYLRALAPDEVQLCTATRPRPAVHELDARGNPPGEAPAYAVHRLRVVAPELVRAFGARIAREAGVTVRHAPD